MVKSLREFGIFQNVLQSIKIYHFENAPNRSTGWITGNCHHSITFQQLFHTDKVDIHSREGNVPFKPPPVLFSLRHTFPHIICRQFDG